MNIHLHANATATLKTRQYVHASHQSATRLADELGVSEDTLRRWKRRDGVADLPMARTRRTACRPPSYPNPASRGRRIAQDAATAALMTSLAVTREFIHPDLSRRSVLGHCLPQPPRAAGGRHSEASEDLQGLHPRLVQLMSSTCRNLPDQDQRTDLFAAIRSRYPLGYAEILKDKSATSASSSSSAWPTRLRSPSPRSSPTMAKKFTNHFCAAGQRQPTGTHAFR